MSKGATHRDFDAAPPERRWTRTLPELWRWINRDVYDRAKAGRGGWSYYVLRGGASVALRMLLPEDGGDDAELGGSADHLLRELRIARSTAPAAPRGAQKFHAECLVFLNEFGVATWTSIPIEEEVRGIAALWREPEGVVRCACGAEVDPNARLFGDGRTCSTCAMAAKAASAKRRVPCACGCGVMVEIEAYHDPERSYWIPCGIRASQAEAAARKAAREAEASAAASPR